LTLFEIDLLATAWRRQQEREDRRASFAPWILAAINRDTEKQREPLTLEEITSWLGHGFQRVPEPTPTVPPTVDELKDRISMIGMMHKALYGENGQGEEGV
jgi:hypothetical protein